MQNIPAPTTHAHTLNSGQTIQITEWTIGAYTLRKAVEPVYTGWSVFTADHDLPRIYDNAGFDQAPDFGVSCYPKLGLIPAGAAAYAAQIMEAAQAALTFNEIVANG